MQIAARTCYRSFFQTMMFQHWILFYLQNHRQLLFVSFHCLPSISLLIQCLALGLLPYLPWAVRGAVGEKLAGPPRIDPPRPGVSHRLTAWTNKTVRGCRVGRGRPSARVQIYYVFQSISTQMSDNGWASSCSFGFLCWPCAAIAASLCCVQRIPFW